MGPLFRDQIFRNQNPKKLAKVSKCRSFETEMSISARQVLRPSESKEITAKEVCPKPSEQEYPPPPAHLSQPYTGNAHMDGLLFIKWLSKPGIANHSCTTDRQGQYLFVFLAQ